MKRPRNAAAKGRPPAATRGRLGAAVVEVAFVGPVTILMIIGIMVAGIGVFRFQQVSTLAHEGARWASMRGPDYEKQTNSPPITSHDVYQNAVRPLAGSTSPQSFQVELEWGEKKATVAVTVRHFWKPQAFLKPVELVGRSVVPVAR